MGEIHTITGSDPRKVTFHRGLMESYRRGDPRCPRCGTPAQVHAAPGAPFVVRWGCDCPFRLEQPQGLAGPTAEAIARALHDAGMG